MSREPMAQGQTGVDVEAVTNPKDILAALEIHDDAGWSLSLSFGHGDEAWNRMWKFSDSLRSGQLVPVPSVEVVARAIVRADADAFKAGWVPSSPIWAERLADAVIAAMKGKG